MTKKDTKYLEKTLKNLNKISSAGIIETADIIKMCLELSGIKIEKIDNNTIIIKGFPQLGKLIMR